MGVPAGVLSTREKERDARTFNSPSLCLFLPHRSEREKENEKEMEKEGVREKEGGRMREKEGGRVREEEGGRVRERKR